MKNVKNKSPMYKNLIFVVVTLLIIVIIVILSLNLSKDKKSNFMAFNSAEFANLSVIGIAEYQASLNFDGISIIYFGSNESEECYKQLKELDKIAKDYNLIIEYINVLELVEEEKKQLSNITDIFNEQYYPNLLIINNGKILENKTESLTNNEIKELLRKHEIIK